MVSDETPIHVKNLYEARSISEFKEDLDFLLENYKPISLLQLIEITQNRTKLSENYFHLTFDDGLKELATIVAPILKEKNIPATFFINTDFLDNKALFYRFKESVLVEKYEAKGLLDFDSEKENEIDELAVLLGEDFDEFLKQEQPYLNSEDVIELIKQGFTIGGHSKNHPRYENISLDEQIAQTIESVELLVEKFNLNYKVFAFPFTDDGVGREFFNKIAGKLDLTFGTAGLKKDVVKNNLQRIPMEENKKGIEIIKSQYLYYFFKMFVGKNTIRRNDK
ncbi:MAG: polysaccharide deacetylase family protein [Flavobacteriales bacterium]|nr:polysaccharide deacetylase family protein [Flavobacteriales bacterium]